MFFFFHLFQQQKLQQQKEDSQKEMKNWQKKTVEKFQVKTENNKCPEVKMKKIEKEMGQ